MKLFKFILPAAAILGGLLMGMSRASAQTWTQTSAHWDYWACVASSADGRQLVAGAVVGGAPPYAAIMISTNSGVNWTKNSSYGGVECFSIASSADGSKLIASQGRFGQIYTSTDSGNTWRSNNVPELSWASVAASADGSKLAVVGNSSIYTSTNSGNTWASNNVPSQYWTSIASSADGSKLVAVADFGGIWTSADSGNSWLSNNVPNLYWTSVASSADGSKLAAVANFGGIWTSTDSGNTWLSNNVPNLYWTSIASSADGRKLAAAAHYSAFYENIYASTNSGNTWLSNIVPNSSWSSVASSADGDELVAAVFDGGISILQRTPTPQLNIAPTNSNLELSWIVPSTNFVLQTSPDLFSWADVTDAPALDLTSLQDEVALSPTNGIGFYRLESR